ncbi:MAG: DUF1800 family protein [Saprospiraceae bacterium]|nr:DUF1800 family protein [Saprospiraceae bacterium]MBP7699429.1 DUF1800 family protein [Saprospiraceae bacterium]
MASLSPHQGQLGIRLAKHLLYRTTFVVNKVRIQEFATKTAQQALDELLTVVPLQLSEPVDPSTGQPWISTNTPPSTTNNPLRGVVISWWTNEARQDVSMHHKLQFFMHQAFTAAATEGSAANLYDYIALLRFYAFGNFKTFAKKMTLDNLMLLYLDNTVNNKNSPNENYAREFLELFTIGKGAQIADGNYTNYTESDIQQAAKVLTGFKTQLDRTIIDTDTNIPMGRAAFSQHTLGNKTFSAAFQNTNITGATNVTQMFDELSNFVEMIFSQPETARFICRRLYRFFVNRNIDAEIEQDIIVPLATTLYNNNYELLPTLRLLFESQHFFDEDDSSNSDEIIGSLLKSPLELVLQTMNHFYINVPDPLTQSNNHYVNFYRLSVLNIMFQGGGLSLFVPSDVAGYPAYYQEPDYHRAWFNASTIITRYKISKMFLTGTRVLSSGNLGGVQLNIALTLKNQPIVSDLMDAFTVVNDLCTFLFSETPDADRLNYFLNIFLDGLPAGDWTYEWQNYLTTNNDEEVKIPLERLIEALMFSPEYQLF